MVVQVPHGHMKLLTIGTDMWFAFENYGKVFNLNGLAEKELVATGAHGYSTEFDALSHRNHSPNAAQSALLDQFQVIAMSPIGGGVQGVLQVLDTSAPPPGPGQKNAPAQQVQNTGQVGPGDLLGKFNLPSWFLRVGEILLGIVLVGVGLARVTGTQNIVSKAVKTAMVVAK